jgi:NADPH-dependent 2,4-dienoyl-CoA reductase/sulfur reductase-like enzyme
MATPTQLRGPRAAPLGALRAPRRSTARSAARAAASSSSAPAPAPKRVVVVGGGWAGFGAVKHLSEQGYDVTLLDAGGAGLTAPTTPGGRAVEPGVKGFWHEYPNIFGLIDGERSSWGSLDFNDDGSGDEGS